MLQTQLKEKKEKEKNLIKKIKKPKLIIINQLKSKKNDFKRTTKHD